MAAGRVVKMQNRQGAAKRDRMAYCAPGRTGERSKADDELNSGTSDLWGALPASVTAASVEGHMVGAGRKAGSGES